MNNACFKDGSTQFNTSISNYAVKTALAAMGIACLPQHEFHIISSTSQYILWTWWPHVTATVLNFTSHHGTLQNGTHIPSKRYPDPVRKSSPNIYILVMAIKFPQILGRLSQKHVLVNIPKISPNSDPWSESPDCLWHVRIVQVILDLKRNTFWILHPSQFLL